MATNLLWFVVAGFLLGFATSTLWEWFYFRKERLKLTDRRIRELEAKLREPENANDTLNLANAVPTVASVTGSSVGSSSPSGASRTSAWGDTSYRSPGVFLESEELKTGEGESAALGRERRTTITSAPMAGIANAAPTSLGPSSAATMPSASSVTPVPPASSISAFVPPSESSVIPRSDQSPADALRAKRGDSPRSRQELLAALRRNSEAVQRGEPLRPENETSPRLQPQPVQPQPPQSQVAQSQLAQPQSAQPQSAPTSQPLPSAETPPLRPTTLVSATPPVHQEEAVRNEVPPATPAQSAPVMIPATPPPVQAAPVPAIPAARQRWANRPELTQRTQEYPDDLSKIKGIGDVYKQRLYKAGIYTWKQIAEGDVEALRRATSAYPSSNVEEWLVQAQKLMEKHGRKNAVYNGPQPDDMTKILGIGPVGAAVLYRAGICTYEQLASTSIEELDAMFPVAVAGDQPDFVQWVARATALADEKHRDQ